MLTVLGKIKRVGVWCRAQIWDQSQRGCRWACLRSPEADSRPSTVCYGAEQGGSYMHRTPHTHESPVLISTALRYADLLWHSATPGNPLPPHTHTHANFPPMLGGTVTQRHHPVHISPGHWSTYRASSRERYRIDKYGKPLHSSTQNINKWSITGCLPYIGHSSISFNA